jgi:site-specific DNA recombinase
MADRRVELDYVFDRLGEAQLVQAYRMLVPERRRVTGGEIGDDDGRVYARVSSARQKEEQTIASQTAALRTYAAAHALEIPPEWVFEDDGYSGATLVRPALERLRDLAAEIEIPVVLCYAPDRLARRYVYQTLLIEEFARVGTEVRFLKGRQAETPEDELLLQFQGMIAEYERAQIAERTRRGKLHRARSGSPAVLCGAPYGYRYVRKSEDADARYEVVESEAGVVRELFRRYVEEQESLAGLVRWLSAQGTPTATGKRRWDRSTLWGMLRNPAYCGRAAFGKTRQTDERPKVTRPVRRRGARGSVHFSTRDCPRDQWIEIPVPPLVSEERFELAARRLEDNQRFARRSTKEPSLLQGLVACQSCGYSYYRTSTRTRKRRLYYYRCLGSDDYRYEQGRVCGNPPVRQDYLDEAVWNHVTALLTDPKLIQAELERRLKELRAASPITAQKAQLERELRRAQRAIHRLVEAYQEELIALDELRRRTPELRKKATSLQAQLEALEAQAVDRERYLQLAENLEGFLARLSQAARSSSIPERQRVLRLLVREVLVGPERVVIRHSIPSSRGDPGPSYRLRGRSHRSTRCLLSAPARPCATHPAAISLAGIRSWPHRTPIRRSAPADSAALAGTPGRRPWESRACATSPAGQPWESDAAGPAGAGRYRS